MIDSFIYALSSEFTPVVSEKYISNDFMPLDLAETNAALIHVDVSSSKDMERYIRHLLDERGAKVAYGGYLEKRAIYSRSHHFNQSNPETERNIHLGVDLWCPAGTTIIAPLDGIVHSVQNNDNFGDYGPTIILEHNYNQNSFYTLYGHLSLGSLQIPIGKKVLKGEEIAILGDAEVNGDYAPHLHFQIIKDLEGRSGDYPGVCSKKDLEAFKNNCPDPNLLLKIY